MQWLLYLKEIMNNKNKSDTFLPFCLLTIKPQCATNRINILAWWQESLKLVSTLWIWNNKQMTQLCIAQFCVNSFNEFWDRKKFAFSGWGWRWKWEKMKEIFHKRCLCRWKGLAALEFALVDQKVWWITYSSIRKVPPSSAKSFFQTSLKTIKLLS